MFHPTCMLPLVVLAVEMVLYVAVKEKLDLVHQAKIGFRGLICSLIVVAAGLVQGAS